MLIQTRNLSKSYGKKEALKDLNLDIAPGQLIAYIGTNGAGKSTTIRILTGLMAATSGTVQRADNLRMGMVFQDSILDKELSVLDNLKSRLALYSNQDEVWLERIIALLDLAPLLKQTYGTLSGGQRRRVDIARSLINRPNLLFLDEPTTGLDVQTRQAIWQLFRRLQQEEGLTIFLTTHYLEEAEQADMAYIVDSGRVLVQGSAQDLKENYAPNKLLIQTQDSQAFLPRGKEVGVNLVEIEAVDTPETLALLSQHQTIIDDFTYQKGDMNAVYLALTGARFEEVSA